MTAIFPGTFDPITNGHLDIIRRFRLLWPSCKLIVAVAEGGNAGKRPLFSLEERFKQIHALTGGCNVEAKPFSGLLVEFARSEGAGFIVRGLRNGDDFNYEMEMALINRQLAPEIETLFMPAALENMIVSSSAVRQIAGLGGSADWMLPEQIRNGMKNKLRDLKLRG